ncbi:MAG: hypothetical protein Q8L73_01750 [Methylotenera sp.]|nr:hypothetical protein [Methylotenera sp.]
MINWVLNFRFNKHRNLALQKFGRNIHNFSLVERWLKFIVSVSDVAFISSTSGSMPDSKTKRRTDKTQRMMLGQLINEVFHLWNPELNTPPATQDLFDMHLKTSMKIEMSIEDYQALKASYESMLDDRNFLIHQFNEKFNLNTVESCREAISYLDDMREKHLPTILNLQEIVKTHLALVEEMKESFDQ